jgi:hypothetical protein
MFSVALPGRKPGGSGTTLFQVREGAGWRYESRVVHSGWNAVLRMP